MLNRASFESVTITFDSDGKEIEEWRVDFHPPLDLSEEVFVEVQQGKVLMFNG